MKTARIKKGYGMVQRDIMISPNVSVYSKAVYALLVSYAGDNTTCYPSINTMCKNLQLSKPTIIKSITELKKENLVVVQKTLTKKGDYGNNIYEPLFLIEEGGVVNDIDYGGQLDLLGVVKEVDPKNNSKRNNIKIIAFTSFWDMYNFKKDREGSEKSWAKLSQEERIECINETPKYIEYLKTPINSWQKQLYPTTFLNGKRWRDSYGNVEETNIEQSTVELGDLYAQLRGE